MQANYTTSCALPQPLTLPDIEYRRLTAGYSVLEAATVGECWSGTTRRIWERQHK